MDMYNAHRHVRAVMPFSREYRLSKYGLLPAIFSNTRPTSHQVWTYRIPRSGCVDMYRLLLDPSLLPVGVTTQPRARRRNKRPADSPVRRFDHRFHAGAGAGAHRLGQRGARLWLQSMRAMMHSHCLSHLCKQLVDWPSLLIQTSQIPPRIGFPLLPSGWDA